MMRFPLEAAKTCHRAVARVGYVTTKDFTSLDELKEG
jgi:hypothetical protein